MCYSVTLCTPLVLALKAAQSVDSTLKSAFNDWKRARLSTAQPDDSVYNSGSPQAGLEGSAYRH